MMKRAILKTLQGTVPSLLAILLGFLILGGSPAMCQLTTGDVVGTVTDTSGAIIPGAKVILVNLGTQITQVKLSNDAGDYVFTLLPPGHYSVTIEGVGFKRFQVANIDLAAGDRVRENGVLQVGAASETVEVTSATPLLQTDSSTVGSVVGERSVQDLPLNGRNYINLVSIQPGVNQGQTNAVSSGNRPDDRRQTSTISANGQSDFYNNSLIDGADNIEREQGTIAVRPSIEAIAEIKVDTNTYSAEVGRSAGAVVNIITKSGTNKFHGSLYEYFRNGIFDARDFFATAGVVQKPKYNQNQFGGSLGGPLRRKNTFFFADAEDDRVVQGVSSGQLTVPTLFEEQNPGNFSDIAGPVVPTAYLNPTGLAYFKLYPAPNVAGAGAVANFINVTNNTQYALSADGRIDQHFSNGDLLYGRYSYNGVNTLIPGPFQAVTEGSVSLQPGGNLLSFDGPSTTTAHGVQIGYVHPITPNLLLDFKTGYTRIAIDSQNLNHGVNGSTALGVVNGNTPAAPETSGLTPLIFISGGYANIGDAPAVPILDINNTFQYLGAISYTHGAHNIKVGAQLTRRQLNYFESAYPLGLFLFKGLTGNSLEDLLTGRPLGFYRGNILLKPGYRTWEAGFYAQDDWRATKSLTLNVGLRYDIFTPFTEAHGNYANFDYPTLTLITAKQSPHIGVNTSYGNLAPRIGFSQSLGNSMVIRGGYGISYYPTPVQQAIQAPNPPYQYQVQCLPCFNGTFTFPTLPIPAAPSTTNLSGTLTYLPANFNSSSVQMFNLAVQRQLGESVLTVGYVGELGRHLPFKSSAVNIPPPTGPYPNAATQGPGPVPALTTANTLPNVGTIQEYTSQASSSYNALQVVVARRFAHGLAVNANYTYAHGLSDSVSGSAVVVGGTGLLPSKPSYDYGNTAVDVKHRIAVSFTYELLTASKPSGFRAVLEKGWSTNFILFWETGLPFTIVDSVGNPHGVAQINLPQVTGDRPNITGLPGKISHPGIKQFFNLNAFTPQEPGTAGNEENLEYYGPHLRRADLSVFKTTQVSHRVSLQFRAEAYNISNTPSFSEPNSTITAFAPGPEHGASNAISKVGPLPGDIPTNAGGFGQITSTAANINPRQFQFVLKALF